MPTVYENPVIWILGLFLILSSLGILLVRKPVHACLSFMLTLVSLASLYLQLSAEFIAVIQILIYAGAILVIFMFVIILFQDAHQQMGQFEAKSPPALLWIAGTTFTLALVFMGQRFIGMPPPKAPITEDFGTVEYLGHALYIDYFFPFEAVIALFLIAIVGALYIGRKALEINFEKKKIGND